MKCETPKCDREAEHEVWLRGEAKPDNLCGACRIALLRKDIGKVQDVQASKAGGQAKKVGHSDVVPNVSSGDS